MLQFLTSALHTLLRRVLEPGFRAPSKNYFDGKALRRGTVMKPMNVWSMVIFLVIIVLLIIYLRPHG